MPAAGRRRPWALLSPAAEWAARPGMRPEARSMSIAPDAPVPGVPGPRLHNRLTLLHEPELDGFGRRAAREGRRPNLLGAGSRRRSASHRTWRSRLKVFPLCNPLPTAKDLQLVDPANPVALLWMVKDEIIDIQRQSSRPQELTLVG